MNVVVQNMMKKKKQLKYGVADFCWMCYSQLALIVTMLLQAGEAYSYLDLTRV
jgi:hypothetical protein